MCATGAAVVETFSAAAETTWTTALLFPVEPDENSTSPGVSEASHGVCHTRMFCTSSGPLSLHGVEVAPVMRM